MEKIISRQMLDGFMTYLYENERSSATIEKYMRDVKRFVSCLNRKAVDKSAVLEYKASLSKSYAIRSANSMLASVNAFLRFLGWHELCVKQFKVQNDAYCSKERELSKADYNALVRAAERLNNKRLSLVVQTICASGIRVSELRFITAEAVRQGEALVSCKGKTRKVFIVKELQRKLIKYMREQGTESGAIFVTKRGKPLDRSNIWRQMKGLCKEAGVSARKVFPHNLRHLFARTFYGIEKDIARLADILGHSSVNTTRIYTVSSGTDHQRRMENMHLIL